MNKKRLLIILAVVVAVITLCMTNLFAASDIYGSLPATPYLSHDNWDGDGNYNLTMNLLWGTNGSSWALFENSQKIVEQEIKDNSPFHQSAFYSIQNKPNGEYEYYCVLINKNGQTQSSKIKVLVNGGYYHVIPTQPVTSQSPKPEPTKSVPTTPEPIKTLTPPQPTVKPQPTSPLPPSNLSIQYIGRFDFTDPKGAIFAWSGSTIKASFEGTSVSVKLSRINSWQTNNWINVYIDQGNSQPIQIDHDGVFTLAQNLTNTTHCQLQKLDQSTMHDINQH